MLESNPSNNLHIVESLSEPVGSLWKELQEKYTEKGNFNVASPLSSTPLPVYQWIIDHSEKFSNWDRMQFILMDELVDRKNSSYEYISIDDDASYEKFAKDKFLNPLREKTKLSTNIILKPDLNHVSAFQIPIHLLILALGIKGNYANVMPGMPIETGWHIEQLLPEFQKVHTQKGSAYEGSTFSDHGMSLGPQQVLSAENILVIISGEKKRDLTKQLFSYDSFHQEFPLSVVYHPRIKNKVQFYITKDALHNTFQHSPRAPALRLTALSGRLG